MRLSTARLTPISEVSLIMESFGARVLVPIFRGAIFRMRKRPHNHVY